MTRNAKYEAERREALAMVRDRRVEEASYHDGMQLIVYWRDAAGDIHRRHEGPDGQNFGDRIVKRAFRVTKI